MRILILGDTHKERRNFMQAVDRTQPDEVWHMGDVEGDADFLREYAKVPMKIVRGNMDRDDKSLPRDLIFAFGKHKVLMAHGHEYMVNFDLNMIRREAEKNGCDLILFGHLHKPFVIREEKLVIANPGSIAFPRQDGRKHTYLVLTDDPDGRIHLKECQLAEE